MFGRRRIAALVAEFLGTAILTLVTFAISRSGVGFPFFIAAGVGLALAALILILGNASIGHYNPAVTLGLWTARRIRTLTAIAYVAAQFLGALAAWRLFRYLSEGPIKDVGGKGLDWKVVVAEVLGTFILTMGVAAAVTRGYAGIKWAATVGLALFLGINLASTASNGILNPAVALGVQSWNRTYVLGPLLGGLLGANLYELLYAPVRAESSKRLGLRKLRPAKDREEVKAIKAEPADVAVASAPKAASVRGKKPAAKTTGRPIKATIANRPPKNQR